MINIKNAQPCISVSYMGFNGSHTPVLACTPENISDEYYMETQIISNILKYYCDTESADLLQRGFAFKGTRRDCSV